MQMRLFHENIKCFGYKNTIQSIQIKIQFNQSLLVVEQNNQATKSVNAYIVYD